MANERVYPLTPKGMTSLTITAAADGAKGDVVVHGDACGFLLADVKAGGRVDLCLRCNLARVHRLHDDTDPRKWLIYGGKGHTVSVGTFLVWFPSRGYFRAQNSNIRRNEAVGYAASEGAAGKGLDIVWTGL